MEKPTKTLLTALTDAVEVNQKVVEELRSVNASSALISVFVTAQTTAQEEKLRILNEIECKSPEKIKMTGYSITVASGQGSRAYHEDRLDINIGLENPHLYAAVFDGHGGSCASKFGQEKLRSIVQKKLASHPTDFVGISKCIDAAFKELHSEMFHVSAGWNMVNQQPRDGTTASMAYLTSTTVMLACVGDSPIYTVHRLHGKLQAAYGTRLHSIEGSKDIDNIVNRGGAIVCIDGRKVVTKKGSKGSINMTRSLGDFWMHPVLSQSPSIRAVELKNLAYLVLATDGCTLKPEQVAKVLEDVEEEEKTTPGPINAAHTIIGTLNEMHSLDYASHDNVTVIVIRLNVTVSQENTKPKVSQVHLTPIFSKNDGIMVHVNGSRITQVETEEVKSYKDFTQGINFVKYL
uniref:PPM-type phosphatase domain-containing protein n=1 Tax=Panagrellus redivivus TaxID=6233 RepID=A0A7E4W488_PANRE